MRLLGGLHVGADAAVEQQVRVERQDGLDEALAAHLRRREAEEPLRLRCESHALGGARYDRAARRQDGGVVAVPAERGAIAALPLGEARHRVGIGVEEHVTMVEGGP